jgi:hypothetical protein
MAAKPFDARFGMTVALVLAAFAIAAQGYSLYHSTERIRLLARAVAQPAQRAALSQAAAWHSTRAGHAAAVGLGAAVAAGLVAFLSRADRRRGLRLALGVVLALYVLSTLLLA